MQTMENKQKVAIITGASRGLGLSLAKKLQEHGYIVAACSRTKIRNPPFLFENIDVTDKIKIRAFIAKMAKKFKKIDVLINNAGYASPSGNIEKATDEQLVDTFETNVYGPFYFMRETIPIMAKGGKGMIINIGSKAAVYANPFSAIYSASKSAVVTMTQSVAKQFRDTKTNILCVSICPAGMNTEMRAKVYGEKNASKQMDKEVVADIITEIVSKGTVPIPGKNKNSKVEHIKISQGANIIIKGGLPIIRVMEDG